MNHDERLRQSPSPFRPAIQWEREILHQLGRAIWQLVRTLVLSRDPGAWASNEAVRPYGSCLRDALDLIESARRLREGPSSPSRAPLRRIVHWMYVHLPEPLRSMWSTRCGLTSRFTEDREISETRRLLVHIDVVGPGTHDDRLVFGRYLASMAVRLLRKPSREHAMALRLLAHVGDLLEEEKTWNEAARGFQSVEWLCRWRIHVSRREVEQSRWWLFFYKCRHYYVNAERVIHEYRVPAKGVLAIIKGKKNLSGEIEEAAELYRRSLVACLELQKNSPASFPRHVADQARYKIWLVYTAGRMWGHARRAWNDLWETAPEFCQDEVPLLADFPTYAAQFARGLRDTGEDRSIELQQVRSLLQSADGHVGLRHRLASSTAEEKLQLCQALEAVSPSTSLV